VVAERDGIVTSIDAFEVGVAAWRLGAGRARKEDAVSAAAGVLTLVREGDTVEKGQPLFELHADDKEHLALGRDGLRTAFVVSDEAASPTPLLIERVAKS